ncbi:hypothetical protein EAH89_27785 [Roseomonas nepalensis]|uniref:HTH merR-type domain-containing protein n=1 Tax=Muricoccus nepalensis TaxID=1854500 RepID=A0A502F497_9PROT|nr:hypothetical protein [Roseomonas nepalensis]TPG44222.1 hypothetical protein EAH89_27785 [Roseomonas nepalensis]
MPSDPTDYQDRYTSEQVCQAADINLSTLKNWMMRDPPIILMKKDRGDSERGGRGSPLLFSFNRVLQIAITAELVRMGLAPRRAADISLGFSDAGDTAAGFVGDQCLEEAVQQMRSPGQLYPEGLTLLVGYAERTTGKTINVTDETKLLDLLWSSQSAQGRQEIAVIVWVNFLHRRVRAALQG